MVDYRLLALSCISTNLTENIRCVDTGRGRWHGKAKERHGKQWMVRTQVKSRKKKEEIELTLDL